ncbi:DUF4422 domain-containing protein [Segetibacter sp. 3557_3]|uniref:DUF4422 domain-containing protein n=1 Tax=Segetibacter sp. 3557_3 TaxID=2547429 RepID=UPI0010589BC1|nr:DUF4422 domain-containing protein [Segetibacter sp. 3557_3]TDH20882.1 DUF4422 domain-containing protein [Segetibacter sp. 3557_3]
MPGKLQLYSVFHKAFHQPHAAYVLPIHAGKALSQLELNILGDNTGDHISSLNSTFCELTVLYWIWKNASRDTDLFGLCHYRRYFAAKPMLNALKPARILAYEPTPENIDAVLTPALEESIIAELNSADVLVQQPMLIHRNKQGSFNLEQHYKMDHIASDWNALMETIRDLYPDYAKTLPAFNQSTKMSFFNMMVAPWGVWDGYLQWLFDILFEVKNRVSVSENAYQARVFGFMSERLMNLYIMHNQLKPTYLPVAVFDKVK